MHSDRTEECRKEKEPRKQTTKAPLEEPARSVLRAKQQQPFSRGRRTRRRRRRRKRGSSQGGLRGRKRADYEASQKGRFAGAI